MGDLTISCFAGTANDGNIDVEDKFLGKVQITTLSTSPQSIQLKDGTRFVKLASDEGATVYFTFGRDTATATTNSQELRCAESETILYSGINNKDNNTISARI